MREVICPGLTIWLMAAAEPDFESGSLREKFKTGRGGIVFGTIYLDQ